MDKFVLTMVLALTALSIVPPDWAKNESSAWAQVYGMSFGLTLLVLYVAWKLVR